MHVKKHVKLIIKYSFSQSSAEYHNLNNYVVKNMV